MKSFDKPINPPRARANGRSSAPSADSCAALLLETAPRVLRAVRMAIGDADAPALTIPQFRTLHFIQEHPDASLSATAEFLELTLPSTSKLVDQLVRRGMLARVDAPDDRRRMTLRITPKGDALSKNAQALVRRHLADLLLHLGDIELEALHTTLGLLQAHLPSHKPSGRTHEPETDTCRPAPSREPGSALIRAVSVRGAAS
jgi:DNA-binding MarR family transcriptional regulator